MLAHVRGTRKPFPAPPPGSCDCHVHIFADASKYPPAEKRSYEPPDATIDQLERMHGSLGVGRGVLVQAAVYGTDNRLLADALHNRASYRGVAAIDDSISDRELERLHESGVRGARFMLGSV